MTESRNWTREQLLLAFNLYCKIPFGQYHSGNVEVIKLAQIIRRTPSAVAMKLTNFASLDPYHQSRGVKGLSNVSKADIQIWNEFNTNWNEAVSESEDILQELSSESTSQEQSLSTLEYDFDTGKPTDAQRIVKVRQQNFFRKMILTSYRIQCCICGIPIKSLLVASHIIPWRDREDLRLNPHNGLCLCALHDRAFDTGMISLDEEYQMILSSIIEQYLPQPALENCFRLYDGRQISMPDKFIPSQEYLEHHRQSLFKS